MQDVDKKRDLKEKCEEDWMGKKKQIQQGDQVEGALRKKMDCDWETAPIFQKDGCVSELGGG